MASQTELELIVKAQTEQAQRSIATLTNSVSTLNKTVSVTSNIFATVQKAFLPLLAVVSFKKIIDEAENLNDSLKSLESISIATGQNFDQVKQAALDLSKEGIIPLNETSVALRNLLRSGIGIDRATELFKAFRESAALGRKEGVGFGEAIIKASEGFSLANPKLLKTAGIILDVANVQAKFASSIGKSTSQLSMQEKQLAIFNAVIDQSRKFTGDYAKVTGDFGGVLSKLGNSFIRLLSSLGSFVSESNAVVVVLDKIANGILGISDALEVTRKKLGDFSDSVGKSLSNTADIFKNAKSFAPELKGESLEKYNRLIKNAEKNTKEFARTAQSIKEIKPEIDIDSLLKDIDKVKKTLENVGFAPELSKVKNDYSEITKIIQDAASNQLINEREKFDLLTKARQKFVQDEKKAIDEVKKRQDEAISAQFKRGESEPIRIILDNIFPNLAKESQKVLTAQEQAQREQIGLIAGAGKTLISTIGQGAQGAQKILGSAIESAANLFVPGLGPVAGELFNVLAGGPDKVRETVNAFTSSIPLIIENVATSLPVLIEALVVGLLDAFVRLSDRIDEIIERFITGVVRAIPRIVEALIVFVPRIARSLADAMPSVAVSFSSALVAEAPNIGVAVAEAIVKEISGKLGIGGGGGIGGFIGGIGDSLGFAKGGQIVRGGINGVDSVPILAQQGELVVDRGLTKRLDNFVSNGGESNIQTNVLLNQILSALSQSQTVETEVRLNNQVFADIILNLNRTNARMTA